MKKSSSSKRILIGIAGPSASGKTTICEGLKEIFDLEIVHLDNYWKSPDKFQNLHGRKNWELPENLNFSQLFDHLNRLKKGKIVDLNEQVYGIHLKNKKELKPSRVIIIEGFLLLCDKRIRDLVDYKVYIDIPDKIILKRRLDRKRSKDDDEFYCRNIVIKEYKKYGLPTKKYADLIINGTKPINEITREIANEIKKII